MIVIIVDFFSPAARCVVASGTSCSCCCLCCCKFLSSRARQGVLISAEPRTIITYLASLERSASPYDSVAICQHCRQKMSMQLLFYSSLLVFLPACKVTTFFSHHKKKSHFSVRFSFSCLYPIAALRRPIGLWPSNSPSGRPVILQNYIIPPMPPAGI